MSEGHKLILCLVCYAKSLTKVAEQSKSRSRWKFESQSQSTTHKFVSFPIWLPMKPNRYSSSIIHWRFQCKYEQTFHRLFAILKAEKLLKNERESRIWIQIQIQIEEEEEKLALELELKSHNRLYFSSVCNNKCHSLLVQKITQPNSDSAYL